MNTIKALFAVALVMTTTIASALTSEDTIAATLWMEARGEGKAGIEAVASVIYNRAKRSGKTYAAECLKPYQFSCWNGKKPTALPNGAKGKVWDYCKSVAKMMSNGTFKPTLTATHYYNPSLCNPTWGKKMTEVVTVGKHRFGRC